MKTKKGNLPIWVFMLPKNLHDGCTVAVLKGRQLHKKMTCQCRNMPLHCRNPPKSLQHVESMLQGNDVQERHSAIFEPFAGPAQTSPISLTAALWSKAPMTTLK
jgi:hypothetical protein